MDEGNEEPNSPNSLVILTKDEKRFEVQDVIVKSSRVFSQMMDQATFNADSNELCQQVNTIPIPVEADILELIVQWCEHHKEDTHFPSGSSIHQTTLPFWDKQFFEVLPKEKLYALLRAANYLDLKYLREHISSFIAGTVGNSRNIDEIRQRFEATNDFTKEEYEEGKEELKWAFE